MNKQKIIIDTDMGADDYIAIQIAILSGKFDLCGITTVFGNTTIKNANRNAFKTLDMIGYNGKIKVYEGLSKPIKDYGLNTKDNAFGSNGFSNVKYKDVDCRLEDISAIDFLINKVNNNPKKITIVAIGPLTNIASAIKKDKNFAKNVKEIMIMGGCENGGNITKYAEFNFYNDPLAADIVFNSGAKITMLGWNISLKITINKEDEKYLKNSTKNNKFIFDITRDCAEMDIKKSNTDGACNSDSLLICYMINKFAYKTKKAHVKIETDDIERLGQSIVDYKSRKNATVIKDLNVKKVKKMMYKYLYKKTEY